MPWAGPEGRMVRHYLSIDDINDRLEHADWELWRTENGPYHQPVCTAKNGHFLPPDLHERLRWDYPRLEVKRHPKPPSQQVANGQNGGRVNSAFPSRQAWPEPGATHICVLGHGVQLQKEGALDDLTHLEEGCHHRSQYAPLLPSSLPSMQSGELVQIPAYARGCRRGRAVPLWYTSPGTPTP